MGYEEQAESSIEGRVGEWLVGWLEGRVIVLAVAVVVVVVTVVVWWFGSGGGGGGSTLSSVRLVWIIGESYRAGAESRP
ncbi:hypothetical protein M0802_009371 [Mischocyttarus mexicanus]|nr:hypothetical protein M0802_009371 [Mischocyttarus mexicanus]